MEIRNSAAKGAQPDPSSLVLVNEENRTNLMTLAGELLSKNPPPVFIGAGVSARAGYPTWRALIDGLFDKIRMWEQEDVEEQRSIPVRVADIMHSPKDLSWTAKACFELFEFYKKKNDYYEFLTSQFSGNRGDNPVLNAIVKLPFPHFLTTNYDPSIHESFNRVHNKSLKIIDWGLGCNVNALPSDQSKTKTCVHLHGYHANPSKIILTEDDYQARYFQNARHIKTLVRYLGKNSVVFVGFSLDDMDFMNLLRTLKATDRKKRGRHYAILPLSDSLPDGHVRTETERPDDKYNIKAIFYRQLTNDFLGLEEAIKWLTTYLKKHPASSRRRAVAAKAKPAYFKFDPAKLKRPKFADDPNKLAFGGKSVRNGRRLSATVKRTKTGSRWFRIELIIEAMRGYPDLPDAGHFYVHPTFRRITYPGSLVTGARQIVRTFWAYGAFTVGALVDKGKTALELDLAALPRAPKDFRER